MQYQVYIQNTDVGIIEATNTGNALAIVAKKIEEGEFSFDENKPRNIQIKPLDD